MQIAHTKAIYRFEKGTIMKEIRVKDDGSFEEIEIDSKKVIEDMIEEASRIRVEGDYIVLDFVYEYSIRKEQRKTPETILGWIAHLSEKTWMTAPRLAHFAEVAFADIGIEMQR